MPLRSSLGLDSSKRTLLPLTARLLKGGQLAFVEATQRAATTSSAPASRRVAHSIALPASPAATDADWY